MLKVGLEGPKRSVLVADANNPWPCNDTGCGANVPPWNTVLHPHETVDLVFHSQPANEGLFKVTAFARWIGGSSPQPFSPTARQIAVFDRELVVTQSGDSGPGSLREALDAARQCSADEVPCRIVFRIAEPVPETGWFTIRPRTPLRIGDEHTSEVLTLDATTQTAFSGDTNPLGSEVALDGSELAAGNGLEILGGGAVVVRGFAIGGFPWNGIEDDVDGVYPNDFGFYSAIEDNYIGTDATGLHPLPNGSRGISALEYLGNVRIARNLISGNGRSGIFIEGCNHADVIDNRIGVAADGTPLPNGASGVYFGLRAGYSTVAGNRIADNHHFGLAISRKANHIEVEPTNSIAHNAAMGIDLGVDGPSGDKFDDYDTFNPYLPPPQIAAATYDPAAGATTITGSYIASPDHWGRFVVSVFANDADEAQGDAFLGTAEADAAGRFTLTVPRDLRGKFIAAYGQRALHLGLSGDFFWTSEFGEKAVAVE